ncbi:hypothetical protein AB1K70_19865 [Bremerella sp. JC770]|uniref:hypothetical protein n=1 Tax=Bremerella sp. JC770 TaxID=3232137 RepID=UPI00345A1237
MFLSKVATEDRLSCQRPVWRAWLVVLYTVLMIGGLTQGYHSPHGKPSHPHSTDSECAELSEFESEVKAEIAFLATTPDLVMPYMEVPSAPLDIQPSPSFANLPTVRFLLRGPPVA